MTKRLGPDANPGAGAVPAPDAAHAVRRSSPTLLAGSMRHASGAAMSGCASAWCALRHLIISWRFCS